MNFYKKNISYFLVCILLFPVFFQVWHVTNIHGFFHVENNHGNHVHSCCELNIHKGENQFSNTSNHCPVCEYEFASYDLIKTSNIAFNQVHFSVVLIIAISEKLCSHNGFSKNLRAPPHIEAIS
jgi:hypothetical protein